MTSYDALLAKGYELVERGELGRAVQCFGKAARIDSSKSEAIVQLALLFHRLGDPMGAVDLLNKVIEQDPHNAFALLQAGLIYFEHDLPGDAERCLSTAIETIERGLADLQSSLNGTDDVDADDADRHCKELQGTADEAKALLSIITRARKNSTPSILTGLDRKPKIGALTAVWGRHDLTRIVLREYNSVRDKVSEEVDLRLYAVGSEGQTSREIARSNGFTYIEHPNRPLGSKWNAGLIALKADDLDAVVIFGSDDILDAGYFRTVAHLLRQGCRFVGIRDFYVLDLTTLRLAYWSGYDESSDRAGEPIGLGRCIHRSLLDRVGWELWDAHLDYRLDRSMFARVAPHIDDPAETALLGCRTHNLMALDVKTKENLWSIDQLMAAVREPEYVGPVDALETYVPASTLREIMALSPQARKIAALLSDASHSGVDQTAAPAVT